MPAGTSRSTSQPVSSCTPSILCTCFPSQHCASTPHPARLLWGQRTSFSSPSRQTHLHLLESLPCNSPTRQARPSPSLNPRLSPLRDLQCNSPMGQLQCSFSPMCQLHLLVMITCNNRLTLKGCHSHPHNKPSSSPSGWDPTSPWFRQAISSTSPRQCIPLQTPLATAHPPWNPSPSFAPHHNPSPLKAHPHYSHHICHLLVPNTTLNLVYNPTLIPSPSYKPPKGTCSSFTLQLPITPLWLTPL